MRTCSIDDCDRRHTGRGLCETHRKRLLRTGSPSADRPFQVRNAEKIGYSAAHKRVRRLWGSASQYLCVRCGESATDWAYDGTDPTEHISAEPQSAGCRYSRYPEFYMSLCRVCHWIQDGITKEVAA